METEFTPISALVGGALIALSAVLMMLTTGRIAGISGFVSRLLPPFDDDARAARIAFVAGLVLAPLFYLAAAGGFPPQDVLDNKLMLVAGGVLVGVGSVIGSGCTSGHGVCGLARLSPRSLVATGVFMTVAIAVVYVTRHMLGVN